MEVTGMTVVSEDEAVKQLSALNDLALQGEKIIITRQDQPITQLVSVKSAAPSEKPMARFGSGKGTLVYMAPDFNAPLEDFKEYME
jgi:antitoxin (DNA-binding transcriptional repressor) of toxin-antitoxin stability system